MSDKYQAIFVIDAEGNLDRIRHYYGQERPVLQTLKKTCKDQQFLEVKCRQPGYQTLEYTFLLVVDLEYHDSQKTFTKFVQWIKGRIEDHVWLVRCYNGLDESNLGVYSTHNAAFAAADKWENDMCPDEDERHEDDVYATLCLVKNYG